MADSKKDSGEGTHNTTKLKDLSSPSEHDRLLPLLNVSRVMKKALPAHAKISNEAKETVRECVSEFIAFVTAEASTNCRREKRCAMSGDDLLLAMDTLGFEEYAKHLKVYLQRFREMEDEVTSAARDMDAQGSESRIGIEDYGWYEGQEYGSGSGFYGQMGGGPGSSGLGGPI